MKKLIILGVFTFLLTLVVGFWVYSFLYGNPSNQDSFFTDLGFFGGNDTTDTPVIDTPPPVVVTDPITARTGLRQVTTRPTVGGGVFTIASTSVARFVEAGTGHVYDVDLVTGQETRRSNVSVPFASEAVFRQDGNLVAIRSGIDNQNEISLVTLDDDTPERQVLPYQIEYMSFVANDWLHFTEFESGQTILKGYNPATGQLVRLFSIPFTTHQMVWDTISTTSPSHYVLTKPAASLAGYAYQIQNGALRRFPVSGRRLMLVLAQESLLIGRNVDTFYRWDIYDRTGNLTGGAPMITLPDKCVASNKHASIWCLGEVGSENELDFPDNALKGTRAFNDRILQVDLGGGVTQRANPEALVGRQIDSDTVRINASETILSFRNRIDNTFWVYDLPQ